MNARNQKQVAADVQCQPEEQQRDAAGTMTAPSGTSPAPTESMAAAAEQEHSSRIAALVGAAAGAGTQSAPEIGSAAARDAPFFGGVEREAFGRRWIEVQIGFVDEPRRAVEQADGLVAEVIQRLAQVVADERGKLEGQWDRGDDIDTEQLRVSLQRYRSFLERLLSA